MLVGILGWKREKLPKLLNLCEKISNDCSKKGDIIFTGGSTGFMGAGNKGAYLANKNNSVGFGCRCIMTREPHNNYILLKNYEMCEDFPDRKAKIMHNKDVLMFFPGGVGTLDEFMDYVNLQKTNFLTKKTPIILVGDQYWNSLKDWFKINDVDFPHDHITLISEDYNEIIKTLNSIREKVQ